MPRVDQPARNFICPGCKGTKTDTEARNPRNRQDPCTYCDGHGKVTEHRHKTIRAYFHGYEVAKRGRAITLH